MQLHRIRMKVENANSWCLEEPLRRLNGSRVLNVEATTQRLVRQRDKQKNEDDNDNDTASDKNSTERMWRNGHSSTDTRLDAITEALRSSIKILALIQVENELGGRRMDGGGGGPGGDGGDEYVRTGMGGKLKGSNFRRRISRLKNPNSKLTKTSMSTVIREWQSRDQISEDNF